MSRTLKLFKKVAATSLLVFGIPFSVAFPAEMASPNYTSQEKEDAFAALVILTLPSAALGGWLAWGLRQEHQRKLTAQSETENDRLQSVFFSLLEDSGGKTSILHLAKAAQISGDEAREYLDGKAVEFDATFDVGEQGEITYQFHL